MEPDPMDEKESPDITHIRYVSRIFLFGNLEVAALGSVKLLEYCCVLWITGSLTGYEGAICRSHR